MPAKAVAVSGCASSFRDELARALTRAATTRVRVSAPAAAPWIEVSPIGVRMPAQGWKLHVSSSVRDADETLTRALPVLLVERVSFKVAASPDHLLSLNQGLGGDSQVGKFITVYPTDDA